MEQHDLIQGTPEWHQHRATHFNASDAPAMLGISPYKTRTQLLDELATGIAPEVDEATQRRFDDGHRFEALARPLAEKIIGKKLYPVIGSDGKLSASFDGLTADDSVCFEHKTLNDRLRGVVHADDLPEHYRAQMEQQLLLSGAERCLFMASTWNDDGKLLDKTECFYISDQGMRQRIIAGWEQFEKDLANHQPVTHHSAPVGRAPDTLPALRIEVTGMVTASNLAEFKAHALAVFDGINTKLDTDEDFANAEKTVKWCGDVEDRLESAKQHALSQTASIDELFRTIDAIKAEARAKRLELEKLVKAEKDNRKSEIINTATRDMVAHTEKLNERLGGKWMPAPKTGLLVEAVRGLKSLDSMRDKVNTALAHAKIEANEIADRIELNRKSLAPQGDINGEPDWILLFPDFNTVCAKPADDFAALFAMRKQQHKEAEAKRLEAERDKIRQEEIERLEAERKAGADPIITGTGVLKVSAEGATHVPVNEVVADPQDAVIEHQDEISAFLKTREFKDEGRIRAVLVEFVKFQASRGMKAAA